MKEENGITSEDVAQEVTNILSAKRQRNILLIIILLLLFGAWFGYNKYATMKTDLAISQQNEAALADSVRVEKNKVGDLTYSKNILIADKKNLEDLNADLAEELSKTKGKVRELNKIITQIEADTVYIPTEVVIYVNDDSTKTYGLSWEHDTTYSENNFRQLAGVSKFDLDSNGIITPLETIITKDLINFSLTTGLREKDGNIEIFATSPYPNLVVTEMNGAIIDPKKHPVIKKFTKKKRFGIGPYVGVGIGVNTTPTVNVGLGFQIGIGVHYDIFRF